MRARDQSMRLLRWVGAAALALLLASPPAAAQTVNFDFEGETATYIEPPGIGTRPGALSSLSMTTAGLTLTITRPGSAFDVVSNTGGQSGKPASWGTRSLDPFVSTAATPFILDFSAALTGLSVDVGDYGGDADTLISLEVFDGVGGTGNSLGLASTSYASTFPVFTSLGVSANGIRSARLIGGGVSFPNSVFYDNIRASLVPEPVSLALFGPGLAAAALLRRRRRVSEGS
jgi:hypothetical protein